jgi:uncharacterized SAM-binding protein YcdF (DUF218 family)
MIALTRRAQRDTRSRRAWPNRVAGFASLLGAVLVAGWAAGFVWFLDRVATPVPPPPQADGIVVLTGGPGRIEAALELLKEGRAPRLLISGVGPGLALDELARRNGLPGDQYGDRLTLGHSATTTRGNARETADWVEANGVHRLIVVTSAYHMPRALTELGRALPHTTLLAAPVLSQGGTTSQQVPGRHVVGQRVPGWRLLAAEYTKWLAAWLGLSRLEREPPPSSPLHEPV